MYFYNLNKEIYVSMQRYYVAELVGPRIVFWDTQLSNCRYYEAEIFNESK